MDVSGSLSNGGLSAKLQWIVEDQSVVQSRRGATVGRRYAAVCSAAAACRTSSLAMLAMLAARLEATAAEVVLPIQSQHHPCQDLAVCQARHREARCCDSLTLPAGKGAKGGGRTTDGGAVKIREV